MKINKKAVAENIFLLEFETREELASTFLRFQEFYESPEFKGKIFTLDEYKKWYASERGSFSYYTDWSGFNIPSDILIPFEEGKFDPLSEQEKQFLSLFEGLEHPYYIIGVSGDPERAARVINHEVAHGLFYTNMEYKKRVLEVLARYDLLEIKNWIRSLGGYHESVMDDEAHAYTLVGGEEAILGSLKDMKGELEAIFSEFYKK